MSPALAFAAPALAIGPQLGIPAGAWAATYSRFLARAGASSLAAAGAMFAFIHFCVGHGVCPFWPPSNTFGPGVGVGVGVGVAVGVGVGVGGGVGVAVGVAVAVAFAFGVAVGLAFAAGIALSDVGATGEGVGSGGVGGSTAAL